VVAVQPSCLSNTKNLGAAWRPFFVRQPAAGFGGRRSGEGPRDAAQSGVAAGIGRNTQMRFSLWQG
jgi:hypothetical protein